MMSVEDKDQGDSCLVCAVGEETEGAGERRTSAGLAAVSFASAAEGKASWASGVLEKDNFLHCTFPPRSFRPAGQPSACVISLVSAASAGQIEDLTLALSLALSLNSDLNESGPDGATALWAACVSGQAACCALLLAQRADFSSLSCNGTAPLHAACSAARGGAECARMLICATADINQRTSPANGGSSPLFVASCKGHASCVSVLLESNATLELADVTGGSPLYGASYKGNAHCVALLVAARATASSRDQEGWTPLHAAAKNGHIECLRLLAGADIGAAVEARTNRHSTPLCLACMSGRFECAELLLQARADPASVPPAPAAALNASQRECARLLLCERTVRADASAAALLVVEEGGMPSARRRRRSKKGKLKAGAANCSSPAVGVAACDTRHEAALKIQRVYQDYISRSALNWRREPPVDGVATTTDRQVALLRSRADGLGSAASGEVVVGGRIGVANGSTLDDPAIHECKECVICMDATSSHVFVPCGHVCTCDSCSRSIMASSSTCPVCRTVATTVVKLFL